MVKSKDRHGASRLAIDEKVWSRSDYLAKAFDTEDLAHGIAWVLAQRETGKLGTQSRERAEARFAVPVVAEQYQAVYATAC